MKKAVKDCVARVLRLMSVLYLLSQLVHVQNTEDKKYVLKKENQSKSKNIEMPYQGYGFSTQIFEMR